MRTPLRIGALVLIAVIPVFVRSNFFLNILVFIAINVILAVSLSLLFGYTGQISFAHGSFYGLGAYTSALLAMHAAFPVLLAMPIAALLPAVVAYLIGRPLLRLKGYYLAIATAAVQIMFSVLFQEQTWITGGFNGIYNIPAPRVFGIELATQQSYFYLAWAIALLTYWFSSNLVELRLGRSLRAIREGELAAASVGIDVASTKVRMFALSAGIAGVAGSLYAHYIRYISPESFTLEASINFLLILVMGGLTRLPGAIVGAVFLTALPEVLREFRGYDTILYGAVVIIVMMFAHDGVYGLLARGWDAVRWAFQARRERRGALGIAPGDAKPL